MAGIMVSIGLTARAFSKGLGAVTRRLGSWAKSLGRIGLDAGKSLARGLRNAAIGGLAGATAFIGKSLKEAGRFEEFELQFEALLGSAEAAKARMEEMKRLDLEVPADLSDLLDGSRILTVFTENAHAGIDAMRMMADAAAVTPSNIKEVAFWYGRAYSMIKAGRPFGEAAMRLQEMGLLSGKARNEIEELAKSGSGLKNADKIMGVLNAEFKKFEGAAGKLAKAWVGAMSIFRSNVSQSFAAIGEEIQPFAMGVVNDIIHWMQQLRSDGTFAEWGKNISNVLRSVKDKFDEVYPKVKAFASAIQASFKANEITPELEGQLDAIVDTVKSKLSELVPIAATIGYEIGKSIVHGIGSAIAGGKLMKDPYAGRWEMRDGKMVDLGENKDARDPNRVALGLPTSQKEAEIVALGRILTKHNDLISSMNQWAAESAKKGPQEVAIVEDRVERAKQGGGME